MAQFPGQSPAVAAAPGSFPGAIPDSCPAPGTAGLAAPPRGGARAPQGRGSSAPDIIFSLTLFQRKCFHASEEINVPSHGTGEKVSG